MDNNNQISIADQNEDIRAFEKNYEEAIAQVKADTEKRLQEMKEEHDKYLKELIEKRDSAAAQQKRDEEDTDIKNTSRLLRSVFASMLNKVDNSDPTKTVKCITERFRHFVNDIYFPTVLPGYKIDCEFLRTQRTTISGEELPYDNDVGIRVVLIHPDKPVAKIGNPSGCCGKCLASKHDIEKIDGAVKDSAAVAEAVAKAKLDLIDAVKEIEFISTSISKNSTGLTVEKLDADSLRENYNNIVVAIRQLYPRSL